MNKLISDKDLDREIELESKGMLYDSELTRIKKNSFITEIKTGLGDSIKSNPNKVTFIKEDKKIKFINFIKKILKKF